MCFRDAQAANFVLQGRTFQSETLGGSALSCNPPRRASQSLNNHTAFRLSKARVDAATKIISEEVRSSDIDTSNSSPRVNASSCALSLTITALRQHYCTPLRWISFAMPGYAG
jgi:hypothetical protein